MDDNTVNTTVNTDNNEVVAQVQPDAAIVTPVEASTVPAVPEVKQSFAEKHPKLTNAAKFVGAAAAGGLVVELIHIVKDAITGSDDSADSTFIDIGGDSEV